MFIRSLCALSTFLSLALALRISTKDDTERRLTRRPVRDQEPEGRKQFLDCYDRYGSQFHAVDYVPSLRVYNWDNKISSCCFTGIWMLYDAEDYNEYNTGTATWWAHGVQGVPQHFGHLGFCNFSASRAPRVKILDIFVEPIQF